MKHRISRYCTPLQRVSSPAGFLMSPQHLMTAAPSNLRLSLSPSELTLLLLLRSSKPLAALILYASTLAFICAFCPCMAAAAAAAVDIDLKSARCRGDTKFSGSIRPWKRGERLAFLSALMAIPLGRAVSTVTLLPSLIASSISPAAPGLSQ